MTQVKRGVYRHYKGKNYRVIAEGRDSETLEEAVVYQAVYASDEFGKGVV